MAVLNLYSDNPKDGTTTFDKIRFYEATDSSGTGATLIQTSSIDTTTITLIDPGFTKYTYPSGDTAKFYASTFYDSTNLIETDKSTYEQGGEDRWDTLFKNSMQDTTSTVWTAADRLRFKEDALEALYPDLFRITVDTSLTIDLTSGAEQYERTVPYGIIEISEIGIGDVDNTTSRFKVVSSSNWKVEGNLIHFKSLAGFSDGETIRLVCSKKFQSVGEVPKKWDGMIMDHLRMNAYIKLADDYPRFLTYARMQGGTKVSFENLRVHAREFERKFKDRKAEFAETMMPSNTI